ncbi:MAG: toll/interleukin-1 receptor domain-containing protein [bacterium]
MSVPLKLIAQSIKQNKCVVLLGPKVSKNKKGEPLQTGLLKYLQEMGFKIEEDIDNLFKCKQRTKIEADLVLGDYYKEHAEPSELHKQLAQIPVHLYISTTPDLLLKQAFDAQRIKHEFRYYVLGNEPLELDAEPTADRPALYNLFGSIENVDSLIWTHSDLINYLFSILKDFGLPQTLRAAVQESKFFLFLGFDFEKWYLKLLLKLLFGEEEKISIATAEDGSANEQVKNFFSENYGLEFVDKNIEEYVKNLFEECRSQELLRKPGEINGNGPVLDASSVFISYNHNDKEVALKLKTVLEENSIQVRIDREAMQAGEDIKGFIEDSIRETDVTLSVVSNQSLLSAWVAMETINTFYHEKFNSDKKFIACYIDDDFFRTDFLLEAIDKIDVRITEIDEMISRYNEKKLDTVDLNDEKTRLFELRNSLGKFLKRLRNTLCLDIRENMFGVSVEKIVSSIKSD